MVPDAPIRLQTESHSLPSPMPKRKYIRYTTQ